MWKRKREAAEGVVDSERGEGKRIILREAEKL